MKINRIVILLGDILLFTISLLFILWLKPGSAINTLTSYKQGLILFSLIWLLISCISRKYSLPGKKQTFLISSMRILVTSGLVLGITTTLMFLSRVDYFSRFALFGTLLTLTISELIITGIYYTFSSATLGEPAPKQENTKEYKQSRPKAKAFHEEIKKSILDRQIAIHRLEAIISIVGNEGVKFIDKHAPIVSNTNLVVSTISHRTIDLISIGGIQSIVNLERVNDIRYINRFFETVNKQLPQGGIFIDFFESKNQRKKRILRKFPPVINYIYYSIDFIIKRIFPKFKFTKGAYFMLTRGNNRVLTRAETFGRLYSCGFELLEEMETDKHIFFAAVKAKDPLYPQQPSYGPLIKLKRVGKNGIIINVYKLRTMHPYSEFIQDYVYQKEGLNEGGKFKSDFRVSNIGKFFRIFWLDELPMLLNLIKRDIKIVGVRPISQHYFNLYTKEHQQRRIKYRPGLVPPFYVDNPKTLEEIMASENKYLDAFDKHPIRTDIKYFFKAFYNIIFRKARSA